MCYIGELRLRSIYWSMESKKNRVSVACDDCFKQWFMLEHALESWEPSLFHTWISDLIQKGISMKEISGIH